MRCRHYYYFGEHFNGEFEKNKKGSTKKLDKNNWDSLRTDTVESPFTIENTVSDYETNCMNKKDYADIAGLICDYLDKEKASKVVSCGIGKGILEWHIKRLRPQLHMDCTDYTQKALEKLKIVWPDHDKLYPFDMINGDWRELCAYDELILYRVAGEFDFKTWRHIFARMKEGTVRKIIFVPADINNFMDMLHEVSGHIKNVLRGRKDTACGFLYSEKEFFKMWRGCYEVTEVIPYENTKIYCLSLV